MPTEKWPAVWRAEEQVIQVNLSHIEAQLTSRSAGTQLAGHPRRLRMHTVKLAAKGLRVELPC